MNFWIGTSGFQYDAWKGIFYPEDLPAAKMLPFYSEKFTTTEINYTFHRIPSPKTIENWTKLTPTHFRFGLKAPQKITHFAKLRNCADTVDYFWDVVSGLGERLGPILFQLPPSLKIETALLDDFTQALPPSMRAAFEFRHQSWLNEETFEVLRKRNLALCIADTDKIQTPVVATADWGYLRLRREDYESADVERWAKLVREYQAKWADCYIYFKHEESGIGPKLAAEMMKLLEPIA